jgi:hypothetical protein
MTTVTTWSPGFTVSVQSTHVPPPEMPEAARAARPATPPLALTVTVALWPACSVPEFGATVTLPTRLKDAVTDHDTGPPAAVSVRAALPGALSTIVVGVTLSVPDTGGGVAVVEALPDGEGL